jgi:hypothetical protein
MQETRHTPGPWQSKSSDGLRSFFIQAAPPNHRKDIADVWTMDVGELEARANAQVMAAAPDLLAALQNIYETLDKLAPCPEAVLDELAVTAQKAIAKALGK